jgi:hypothetical protein
MKRRTVNVKGIWNIGKTVYVDGDTVLEIESEKHKIRLHLEPYDTGYIANVLWDILDKQQERLNWNKKRLNGGDRSS